VRQVLREDVEVVAGGVERRDVPLRALPPVVAVVVVGADSRYPLRPQDAGDTALSVVLPAPLSPTIAHATRRMSVPQEHLPLSDTQRQFLSNAQDDWLICHIHWSWWAL